MNNSKGLLILCLSLATVGVNEVWGYNESGTGQKVESIYYALYNNSVTITKKSAEKIISLGGPGASVSFEAATTSGITSTASNDHGVKVKYSTDNGSSWNDLGSLNIGRKKNTYTSCNDLSIDINVTHLKFIWWEAESGATRDITVRNINVKLATDAYSVSSSIDFGTSLIGSEATTKTFKLLTSNANTSEYNFTISTDAENVSISPTTITNNAGQYKTTTITLTYSHNAKSDLSGKKLYVKNGSTTYLTLPLSGQTNLKTAEITWEEGTTLMNVDEYLENPASSTNSTLGVKYRSSDSSVIEVLEGGVLHALKYSATPVTVTAYQEESGDWASVEKKQEITVTNKQKNSIDWTEKLSFEYSGSAYTYELNASASTPITYSIATDGGNIASVSGNTLTIKGIGKTTITATAAETSDYVGVSTTRKLTVRDPNATCDEPFYEEPNEHSFTAADGKSWETPTFSYEPHTVSFQAYKTMSTAVGSMYVYEYVNNSWKEIKEIEVGELNKNSYKDFGPYTLSRTATKVKIGTKAGSFTRYIRNIEVTLSKYLESATTELNFEAEAGASAPKQTFYISYSNIQGSISISCTDTKGIFSFPEEIEAECGDVAKNVPVEVGMLAQNSGSISETLTLTDGKGQTISVALNATVSKLKQSIVWNDDVNYKTTDSPTLTAVSSTLRDDMPVTYHSEDETIAQVSGSKVTFLKDGDVTILANQVGNAYYDAAPEVSKVFHVSKVTPTIATEPTGTAVTYGNALSTSTLSGGKATVTLRGVDNTEVEGTWAWKEPTKTITDNAGTHEYAIVFTPTNTAMYNPVEGTATVTVNKATPTLETENPADTKIYIDDTLTPKINLESCITSYSAEDDADEHTQNRSAITYTCEQTGAVIEDKKFYATAADTFTITATAPATDYYEAVSETITIVVGKHTPAFTWKFYDHIYAGQILEDVASTSFLGESVDLELTYIHVTGEFAVEGKKLYIGNQFTDEHDAIVRVTSTETEYYAQTSEEHTYHLESKKLPKFFLNGVEMSTETENELVLKVGDTANVSFDQIEESAFTYTTNAQFVSYAHNSENHTGVITAIASGDEGFQFHQAGTTTAFDRICQLHIWVNKHADTLDSPIHDNDIWMVDSVYTGAMYSIKDDGYAGKAQEAVVVESDNESVIRHQQDGSWKAVGEGTATITIRQINNAYWTGDTITRVIRVHKYTPEITWNIESDTYAWGSIINTPVSSTNTDVPFTITSNNPSVANYVNGRIEVYNTTGTVTFTLAQEGNYKWNAATTNLTKSFSTFQPKNHVPFTLTNDNNSNFYSSNSGTYKWSNGYKIGNGGINTFNKNTSSVTIRFTGVPDKLSFTKEISTAIGFLPGDGDCNCYVYESADGNSWSQCYFDKERVGSKEASNIQLQPTTRYLKFEYKESCLYCTYSNITVTERSSIEPQASSLDFGTGYNGNTAAKRTVVVDWYSVMSCTATISGVDASQFYLADDSKTIPSILDNSGSATLSVFYTHEENKTHSATLTITSADTPAKTATITLSGTTECAPQEIIWREDITPLPHNGGLYEGAAWASSGGEVVLTSDDESIVKVVGNGLQPVAVGTTTVHAYQAGDDIKWQPVNAEKEIEVTSLNVQHLIWNDQLNNIKCSEGNSVNIALTAQSDAIASDPSLVVTYELDDAAKAFASVSGNQLTITGWGSGYITAKQAGNANYIATQKVKPIISRNPDADCKMLAGEYWEEYTLHTIASKEIDILNGEPATIEFDAKMDAIAIGEGLHLDEWYDNSWHEFKYIDWDVMAKNLGNYAHYGPYNLNRKSTKVRLYTNTGATMTRTFKNVEITLIRYLELAQNDMSFAGVDKGAFLDQTFYINYSNLRGTLDVELQNTSSNLQVLTETVGEECGEIGKMVPVTIRCMGNVCGTENNVVVLSNKGQKLEVPISATVVPPTQNITWNPTTDILTTDVVALDATCTSNLPISYSSNNSEVATVQQDGEGNWSMTIIKDGPVTITASQAGSIDWSPAPDKNVVFTISKATPIVTTWATPSEVTKWSALSTSTLTGGEASVAGTFSWQNGTQQVERGNSGYTMVFTPNNTNWYNTVTNTIVVPVAKDPQTITWNYTPQPIYCNAQLTFDATASSGLKVRYESSDQNIAYVNDNRLVIIKGGNVTITAIQDGDDTWAYASLSKDIEILRWTPTVVTLPTANSMLIGQHLDNATLIGGRAEVDNQQVDGSFAWKDGSTITIDEAGKATRTVVFTPSNPNHFNSTTCEVEVEVKKYAPTVTHNLTATAITYGQSLNESVLSGTLTAMDEVKYPNEPVEGTYTWKEPTTQLEVGNHNEIVRFTPTNLDWYDVVDVEVPVVVNKARATTATAVVNMLYGQTLEEVLPINTTADAVSGIVEGTITWDASVNMEEMPAIGEHDYSIHMAVTDPNYVAETIDGTCHVVVEKGFVFNGSGGTTEWNTTGNWLGGEQPNTEDAKVIVVADATIIDSEVSVGSITIKQGANVTIEKNGVLNVGDIDCVSRKEYGNMIIKQGGKLNLNEGEVQVNDFTLEAALGGIKDNARVDARSGQVTNAAQLVVNGNAYFEIALDANGECTQGWYDFTVPFPVNALSGVQRYENGVLQTNLKNEVNYAIMSYHEDVRAQGKYGWSKYRGIMQPGQCYSITIDNYYNVYRFVKTADGALNTSNEVQITATDGGADVDKGWNGIGNGTLSYANIAASGIDKVQVYDHATNSYSPIEMSGTTFVVGSSFFVQTPQTESVVYNKANTIGQLYAPKQTSQVSEEFVVTLSKTSTQNEVDRLYLSATEDAIDSYEIGHDLAKFEVSSSVAQMWCSAYDMKLCDVELPLEYETALFPITFSAPKPGEYTLSVAKTRSNDKLYLLYQGDRVAELTMSDYVVELDKGTDTNYALQIVSTNQAPTQMENNEQTKVAHKVIIDNQLYIFYDKKVYDITGKCIK